MVAMKEKKSLFGGALRSAGLLAAAAMSTSAVADFDPLAAGPGFIPSQSGFYGSGPAAYVYEFGYTYAAAFAPSYSYAGPGLTVASYSSSTLIGTSMNLSDAGIWDYAVSLNIQWFTATSFGKEVTFAWDFTDVSNAIAYVYQVGVGVISPLGSVGTSGSATLFLDNGNTYAFLGQIVVSSETGSGYAYIQNIPAPGALGMLGLGLLGTRKRRRRE